LGIDVVNKFHVSKNACYHHDVVEDHNVAIYERMLLFLILL